MTHSFQKWSEVKAEVEAQEERWVPVSPDEAKW